MPREGLSRGDLLGLVAVLAAAGAAVAAYLTYEWYNAFRSSVCDINTYFSCTAVGKSSFSVIAGIPTSTVGLAGFLVLLGLALASLRGVERLGPWSVDSWTLLFASLGAIIGLGLTFLEVFIINAVCILCVTGFALDLVILVAAVVLWREGARPAASEG